jgi:hypothetical protein
MSDDSDRKYRQRGYQDDSRDRDGKGAKRGEPAKEQTARAPGRQLQDAAGPRTPNLMGSREVCRCSRCGNLLSLEVADDGRCPRCGVDLHSCVQCVSFDTSARFECSQAGLPARVSPKDERNACTLYAPRTTIERQTGTAGPTSARQAFDDLFK